MEYTPHKYQNYATEFIKENKESALLLDMGLGKTVISLTAIKDLLFDSFEISKVLIIAPLRVARDTWKDEIENKFLSKVIDEFKERPSIDFLLDKSLNKFNSVLCEINKSDARSLEKIIKIFEDNYTF